MSIGRVSQSVESVEGIIRHRGRQSNAAVGVVGVDDEEEDNNMGRWMGMRRRRIIIIWGRWEDE